MLLVNVYLAMLLKMEPYANQLDNFLAVCLNAPIVIFVSVLLKMDAAHLLGETSDGFDIETAAVLLVACNVLVVVMSIAAYWIAIRDPDDGDAAEVAGNLQGIENLAALEDEPDDRYRRMADALEEEPDDDFTGRSGR